MTGTPREPDSEAPAPSRLGSTAALAAREKALLIVVLLAPRVARMAWPEAWLEDADYMHASLLLSRGFVPFLDFPSPHIPVLEAILGAVYLVFGPSLRSAELVTQAAVAVTAWLLYLVVRREHGFRAALAAAAIYGCSSLVFRYHIFEREIFTNLFLAAGLLVLTDGDRRGRKPATLLVLAALGAVLVKLTAIVDWAAVGVFLLLRRDRRGGAAWFGLGLLLALLGVVAAGITIFGDAFIAQVFLFHFLKGGSGSLAGHAEVLRQSLDLTGILGIAGLFLMVGQAAKGRSPAGGGMLVVLLLVAFRLVFFLFLSPTFWPHNVIPFLIPLSWAGGVFVLWAVRTVADAAGNGLRVWLPRAAGIAAVLIPGTLAFPLRNDHWRLGSAYGFGYQDRREIRALASAVRELSARDDRIIAPPAVAVESDRAKLVHYREVAGPMRAIGEALDTGRLGELRKQLKDRGFFEHLFVSAQPVGEEMARAIAERSVPVVVPDSRFSLVSETRVRESYLQANGYREAFIADHYSVWVNAARDRTSPTR